MFILDQSVARAGSTPKTGELRTNDDDKEVKEEYKLPSQGEDSRGVVREKKPTFADKPSPFSVIKDKVLGKLSYLGLQEEDKNDTAEKLANTKSKEGRSIDYYLSDRYVLVKTSTSAKEYNDSFNSAMQSLQEESPELAEEINRFFAHEDKETQEIRMVMTILTFSASNPKSVLSSLGNLLSSLETAGAKQLAGSSIAEVAAFAAREALKIAKEHPEEAKQILSILGSINPSCLCVGDSCSDVDLNGTGISIQDGRIQIESQPQVTTIVTEDKYQMFDMEDGKFVDDDEFVLTNTEETAVSCEESCDATKYSIYKVSEGFDNVKEAAYTAGQVHDKAEEEKSVTKNALVKLNKIQDQVRNGKEADIRELTPEERALLGTQFNIVA